MSASVRRAPGYAGVMREDTHLVSDSDFPNDENSDVLRRLAPRGVDLISPRVVDFEHCFPEEASAVAFYEAVRATVLEARLIGPEPEHGNGWEVQCRQRMIPTHAAITDTEQRQQLLPASSEVTLTGGEH